MVSDDGSYVELLFRVIIHQVQDVLQIFLLDVHLGNEKSRIDRRVYT